MTSDDSELNSWKREAAAAVGKRKGAAAIQAGGGERILEIVLLLRGSNMCHAEAVEKTVNYRYEEIGQGESGRQGDERLLCFFR